MNEKTICFATLNKPVDSYVAIHFELRMACIQSNEASLANVVSVVLVLVVAFGLVSELNVESMLELDVVQCWGPSVLVVGNIHCIFVL